MGQKPHHVPLTSQGLLTSSSSNSGTFCFFTSASLWLPHPFFYPLAKNALSGAHVLPGSVGVHEKLLKDIGFSERFAQKPTYHLRNICFFKLYGNARCASEIRIRPWGTKRSSPFTADNAELISMNSFPRDSAPLFNTAVVSREISKDGLIQSVAISTCGVQDFSGWYWSAAWVPRVGLGIPK